MFYSSVNGVLFDKSQSTLVVYPGGLAGGYALPGSVSSIGVGAFSGCTSLTNIAIPRQRHQHWGCCVQLLLPAMTNITIGNSVTNIGGFAFVECTQSAQHHDSIDSVTNIGARHVLRLFLAWKASISPTASAASGQGAFEDCTSLTNLTIPDSVTNIGEVAFENCIKLSEVYFQGNAPGADSSNISTIQRDGLLFAWHHWLECVLLHYTGVPAVLWNPLIQTGDGSFGVQNNQFGFNITGTANIPIVVEACTNHWLQP